MTSMTSPRFNELEQASIVATASDVATLMRQAFTLLGEVGF